jgi:hypothetical protein
MCWRRAAGWRLPVSQRRSWLDGWLRSEQSALQRGTGVSDTLTADYTLAQARGRLAAAAARAASEGRWTVATSYLSLSGRLAQYQERLAVWPEEPLSSVLLWRTAGDCERLADRAQREDWPELDALTDAEQYLQDLATESQREEEGL